MLGPTKMCSKLWTADILTLVHVLMLLFVGSCFGAVAVTTEVIIVANVTRSSPLLTTLVMSSVSTTTRNLATSTTSLPSTTIVSTSVTGSSTSVSSKNTMRPTEITTVAYPDKLATTTGPSTRVPAQTSTAASAAAEIPPHSPARLEERLAALDCDLPLLPNESRLWRGNETHELTLPITMAEECGGGGGAAGTSTAGSPDEECPAVILSWEGAADIQSGDILIVRVRDAPLVQRARSAGDTRTLRGAGVTIVNGTGGGGGGGDRMHRSPPQPAVYQVTRQGHEHCDVTEGVLLDITPLAESGAKLVTLYDKDLTEGVNLLIVVSESWGSQCVRLKVTVKSDNCGDNQECSGKGVCYSNVSMEGYECQCCPGFMGPHCEEQDACNPSPCTNQGICVDISQGHDGALYQCLCPYGYTGKTCAEQVDPCSSSPCQNGGRCGGAGAAGGAEGGAGAEGAANKSAWRCACAEGWAGARCERPAGAGACAAAPCVHGICVEHTAAAADDRPDTDEEGYRCFCQPGFAGARCEYEYNECESSPCANGGTCTDRVGGFACACGRGYTGRRCQLKVDLCSPNPCTSRRYCIDRGNSYACECPRGYTGINCELPAKAACDNNPCAHGGTCWSGVDSFYCACRPGYTGKLCEDDFILESVMAGGGGGGGGRGTSAGGGGGGGGGGGASVREVRLPLALYHDRLHNVYIAAGTLGAAIAIVGLVVTACHCRVNKTYARFLSRVYRASDAGAPHHWLQDKRAPHAGQHAPHAGQHAPLDTADMYYTLDFSDSQSSPLIQ